MKKDNNFTYVVHINLSQFHVIKNIIIYILHPCSLSRYFHTNNSCFPDH